MNWLLVQVEYDLETKALLHLSNAESADSVQAKPIASGVGLKIPGWDAQCIAVIDSASGT
jgi:hypothetical protein